MDLFNGTLRRLGGEDSRTLPAFSPQGQGFSLLSAKDKDDLLQFVDKHDHSLHVLTDQHNALDPYGMEDPLRADKINASRYIRRLGHCQRFIFNASANQQSDVRYRSEAERKQGYFSPRRTEQGMSSPHLMFPRRRQMLGTLPCYHFAIDSTFRVVR